MSMFCRQCEQTFRWKGCETMGVCGKDPEVAALQDVLIHACKGFAACGQSVRQAGVAMPENDYLLMEGVFATLTNVNFDPDALEALIRKVVAERRQLQSVSADRMSGDMPAATQWVPAEDRQGLLDQGAALGLLCDGDLDKDRRSLRELLLYGLKGMAAYAHHAYRLGEQDPAVSDFLYKGMAALADLSLDMETLLGLVMECGAANLVCLEMLDRGHTARFGHPEPTQVKLGYLKGPAIVVSGHDLHDLEQLLVQTEGKGINIFTHGEMLPGNAYPGLKKYTHLAGHYGTAWQNQQREFVDLPGAILMTTNCIQEPDMTYQDRIFTTGAVGWPNIAHIPEGEKGAKDFTPVIEKALSLGGFSEDNIEKEITIGFGHHTILSHAEQIVAAVKAGQIRHFFLIGGCDGARPGRNYYTKMAESIPDDCLILTLACGKNRINRLDYPTVAGFPKLLDCGQCNDAYSAIVVAKALSEAFECGINDLPLTLNISWYEQKAVAVLLTLLNLGVKNIKLGPSLPAFLSENVLKVLVEQFNIQPTSTVEDDLRQVLGASV